MVCREVGAPEIHGIEEDGERHCGEGQVFVEPQINQRLLAGQFEPQEDDKRSSCHHQEPLDVRGVPALALPLRQSDEQAHEKHRQREQASEVEERLTASRVLGITRQHQPHTQEPWHQIHVEHHAPAQILRHVAADHGSYRRPKGCRHAVQAHGRAALLGRKGFIEKDHAPWA